MVHWIFCFLRIRFHFGETMLLVHQTWPVHYSFQRRCSIFHSLLIPFYGLMILNLSSTPSLKCIEYQNLLRVSVNVMLLPRNDERSGLENNKSLFIETYIRFAGILSVGQQTTFLYLLQATISAKQRFRCFDVYNNLIQKSTEA